MREGLTRSSRFLIAIAIVLALAIPWLADQEGRPVLLPISVTLALAVWTWSALWSKHNGLPIVDVGALFAFIVVLYTVVPLVGYLAGGLAFSLLSDSRLVPYDPTPREMGAFAWRYVLFFG